MKNLIIRVIQDKESTLNLQIGNQIYRLADVNKLLLIDKDLESGQYEVSLKKVA